MNPRCFFFLSVVIFIFCFSSLCPAFQTAQETWVIVDEFVPKLTNHPSDMAIGPAGEIYVAGQSESRGDPDWGTLVKWSPDGTKEWFKRWPYVYYEGSLFPISLALDSTGNAYISDRYYYFIWSSFQTGWAYFQKFQNDGTREWIRPVPAWSSVSAAATVTSDDRFVAVLEAAFLPIPKNDWEVVTMGFNSGGNYRWIRRLESGISYATDIVPDNAGNVFVYGYGWDSRRQRDQIWVQKFNPGGLPVWISNFGDPNYYNTYPAEAALDDQGNIYVAGYVNVRADNIDATIFSLSEDGAFRWDYSFDSGAREADFYNAITVAPNGPVYAGGSQTDQRDGMSDMLVHAFGTDGTLLWTWTYDDVGLDDSVEDMAVDAAGNVYITGIVTNTYQTDILTVKLKPDGTEAWRIFYDDPFSNDFGPLIRLDQENNVIITAETKTGSDNSDYLLIKYTQICNGCHIDSVCYDTGVIEPGNSCRFCDPTESENGWTDLPNGETCDDGLFCNGQDSCLSGGCDNHAGDPCSLQETCDETLDECTPSDEQGDDVSKADDDSVDDDDDDDKGCGA